MKIELKNDQEAEPTRLFQELVDALGYKFVFEVVQDRRTETTYDDLGNELVQSYGYIFDINDFKDGDEEIIDQTVQDHISTFQSKREETTSAYITIKEYKDLLQRVDNLEARIK